jgi:uncharacterized RDD family membrane protein YckC
VQVPHSESPYEEDTNPPVTPAFQLEEHSVSESLKARQLRQSDTFRRRSVQGLIGDRSGRRFWATEADFLLAAISSMMSVIALPDFDPLWKGLSFYLFFLLYFQLTEFFLQATPAKWFFGLRVKSINGCRPSFMQISIRTLLRVVELNPILLGAFPAALFVLFTRRHVRLGDMLAGTVVARTEDL